jgi:hypothetical protein
MVKVLKILLIIAVVCIGLLFLASILSPTASVGHKAITSHEGRGFVVYEKTDPITNATTDIARADDVPDTAHNFLNKIELSCHELHMTFTVSTFDQHDKPSAINQDEWVRFRFNGWVAGDHRYPYLNVTVVAPTLSLGEVVPIYANVPLKGVTTRMETEGGISMEVVRGFLLSDPEFVMDITMADGVHDILDVSLNDPPIRTILTKCGFKYAD